MSSKKSKISKRLFQFIKVFLVGLIIIAASVFGYIIVKKNEISKDLLQQVNQQFIGNFVVKQVSIGSLLQYPEIDVKIGDLYFLTGGIQPLKEKIVFHIPQANFQINLSDLKSNKLIVDHLRIKNAQLYIERDSLGNMTIAEAFSVKVEDTSKTDPTAIKFLVNAIAIETSKVIIRDKPTNQVVPITIKKANGELSYFSDIIKGKVKADLDPISNEDKSNLIATQVPINFNASFNIDLKKEQVNVHSKSFLFGWEYYNFKYVYNYSKKSFMDLMVNSSKEGINFNSIFINEEKDSIKETSTAGITGVGHFKSKFYWDLNSKKDFATALKATINLEGQQLSINGMDLDHLIDTFKESQQFNFLDIGAVLFAGPAGLAVTKGGDFAKLAFVKTGEQTKVTQFVTNWSLENGVLKTNDVALSTKNNLIATEGWYDLNNDNLDFKFSIVDEKGCEVVSQRIYGNYDQLQYGKVKLLKTFLGPIQTFFKNIGLIKCESIYKGKIQHPKNT